jgi:hypothetical protein
MSLMYFPFAFIALLAFSKKIRDLVGAYKLHDVDKVKVHSLFLFLMVVVTGLVCLSTANL